VPDLCDSGNDSYYRPVPSNKEQLFFQHQHHWDCSRKKNVLSIRGMSQFLSCSVVMVVSLYHPGGWPTCPLSSGMYSMHATSPDWVSIAVFVVPYFPFRVFPFRVVPVRVYTLGPEPPTLLE
jgi:hypothetical protein